MKQGFSKNWKESKQPRKQRKYRYNAPMHVMGKFLSAHLSKELRTKYGRRSVSLRKGDKVKVLRGSHKGHVGKIDRVKLTEGKVIVSGIEISKKDGSKMMPMINPTNIIITELELGDKKREASITKQKIKQTKNQTKPNTK